MLLGNWLEMQPVMGASRALQALVHFPPTTAHRLNIGMALREETLIDHRDGRIVNANIAEYLVPVNADVQDIKVIFVDEPDDSNPLGVKGVGEIGIVGVAAAIANAVYHATGKRVRDLPITLDKLGL